MERGQRDCSVLVLCWILALVPGSSSRGFGSCSVKLPPPGENSCDMAWVIDVTNADLVPFTTCKNKSWPDGLQSNEHDVTSTSPARLSTNKSVCSQIHIDIADLTYISVHVCKCLNCSLETKTILHSRDVWLSAKIYKTRFPSAGRRSRHVYCLWGLLTKTSQTSCHIQDHHTRHILLCQTQSSHSENGCFRIWWQHRMCEGFVKCKALSSSHTCDSLFNKNIQILLPARTSEESISFRELEFSRSGSLISSNLTAPELLSADVPQALEDTNSSSYACSNCSTLTSLKQKRDSQCPPGLFGLMCSEMCHCRFNKQCHINGTCFSGRCATGWEGASCNRRACPENKYGFTYTNNQTCKDICRCPKGTGCDVIHGACLQWQCSNVTIVVGETFNCLEAACPRRKLFFSNCSDTCHCAQDTVCDSVSGLCPTPVCNATYEPPTCSRLLTWDSRMRLRAILLKAIELTLLVLKLVFVIKIRFFPVTMQQFIKVRKSFIEAKTSFAVSKK
ncbi:hypothetical protein BsWGS_26887 [Bradybaena similaris]